MYVVSFELQNIFKSIFIFILYKNKKPSKIEG